MIRITALTILSSIFITGVAMATPEEDRTAFSNFYTERFSDTPTADFINGVYSIDAASRLQWQEIEEFPPYEFDVDSGETLYQTPFANGKGYADCFGDDLTVIRGKYPKWDANKNMVMTLELDINNCREANGEKALKYKKGPIAQLSSYIAMQGRGNLISVTIPADSPNAMAAYENGKEFFYSKRGQLNFSCADCHMTNSGNNVRADLLSPALGHTSHFPVYRSKWGELGTLHRRFGGCNKNVRAEPFPAQGEAYRNLEYFLSYMNNGLALNGPGARK
ncbi:MAG: sulfur-oxidizing protein SoxA [Gammaproteobacteria bacterium]|jgi:sulfur-oxidizing protein SoxA